MKKILFNPIMLEALDNNRKWQTRRFSGLEEVNENPEEWKFVAVDPHQDNGYRFINEKGVSIVAQPKYQIGETIYVAETFSETSINKYEYKALNPDPKIKWKSGMFMPECAARTTLKIIDVKVERLCDISIKDFTEEGIEIIIPAPFIRRFPVFERKKGNVVISDKSVFHHQSNSFISLLQAISKKDPNPSAYVFVYKFTKTTKCTH